MTYDWLTAALLEPILHRNGSGLGDFASALYAASTNSREEDVQMADGRRALVSEFTTDRNRLDMKFVELAKGGWDPFGPPTQRTPLKGLPPMWGAIAHVGSDYVFKPSGIRLHNDLIALPSSGGGMMLFRAAIADTIAAAMVGQSFGRVVTHPDVDPIGLVVRRMRRADEAEIEMLEAGRGLAAASADEIASGISVATFRNDKTPRRFEIPF